MPCRLQPGLVQSALGMGIAGSGAGELISEGVLAIEMGAVAEDLDMTIQTFSAHFETFYADTYVVVAPDHALLPKLLQSVADKDKILAYCKKMLDERDLNAEQEPDGIFTGRYIEDPVTKMDLPIWVANLP